jgi:hypothetical protein
MSSTLLKPSMGLGATLTRDCGRSWSLVRHLHAFIRDVELNEAEWFTAIEFRPPGQMCSDVRQELFCCPMSSAYRCLSMPSIIGDRQKAIGNHGLVRFHSWLPERRMEFVT